jgi:DNA-binding response OmpR family regulator
VADDNSDVRAYVGRMLGRHYDVTVVPDGLAALDVIRANPPDLVLTDVMMPRLDGFGLLQALRADPQTREMPVILLTARAGEEERIEGLETGADEYISKPFNGRELRARVEAAIKLQRLRGENNRTLHATERRLSHLLAGLRRLQQLHQELFGISTEIPGLEALLKAMMELHQTNRGLVCRFDPIDRRMEYAVALGLDELQSELTEPEGVLRRPARIACQENRPVILEDADSDAAFEGYRDAAGSVGLRAAYACPVRNHSGECVASLTVFFGSEHRPDDIQLQLSEMIALQATDFIHRLGAHNPA